MTKALIAATKSALATHELIKIRISDNTDGDRHELAAALSSESASELVGLIGRTVLLYRRHPSKPKIELPKVGKEKEKADKKAKKDAKKSATKSATTAKGAKSAKKSAARKPAKAEEAGADASDLDLPDDGDDDGDFDETEYN